MVILQEGFSEIKREYIFPIIEKKLSLSQKKDLLNLGIGDVALPLVQPAAEAFYSAIEEMQQMPVGYPPSHGNMFLKQAIYDNYYKNLNIDVDDIFISDGINSDLGNLQELFSFNTTFAVHDPSYPVPLDVCYMAGRKQYIQILPTTPENNFLPIPPSFGVDVVYLCTPNNPSGTAMDKKELTAWVDWANSNNSILIIDAAYCDFIRDDNTPKSIYEIKGAENVAIELRSFSKSAGFTGLRCSYSVVPKSSQLHKLWAKRMATKSNGVSYPVQKAAAACLTPAGLKATKMQIDHYLNMASILNLALKEAGFATFGSKNAPYVFVKCPNGFSSWDFFDYLLDVASIVSVPGSGFGNCGEGYIRLSGFITHDICIQACNRLKALKCFV